MGKATVIPTATGTGGTEAAGARRDLARRGVTLVTLAGGSMRPTFREGDTLLVRRAPTVRPGEVALLEAGGGLLLHRIVGRFGSWVVHAGDRDLRWGLAGIGEVIGRVDAPRRGRPAPRAHAALLAGRLGAILCRLGISPRPFRLLPRALRVLG